MASEPEGAPPQPVRPGDTQSPGVQPNGAAKDTPVQPGATAPAASGEGLGSLTSISSSPSEAGTPTSPQGAIPQSDSPAPAPVPQNPEGFPAGEIARTSSAGEVGGAVPSDHTGSGSHEPDPYHQEHQHDYGSEYHHHDDPHHHDSHYGDHHSGYQHDDPAHHHSGGYEYPAYTPPPPEEEHGFVKAVRSVTNALKGDDDSTGEGGGPVKPFLDHLEDLRWMLIKVSSSLVVAFVTCLVGANWLVDIMKCPLVKAHQQAEVEAAKSDKPKEHVPVMFDTTNRVGSLPLTFFRIDPSQNHTNKDGRVRSVQLVPREVGSNNWFLALQLNTNAPVASDPLVNLIILGPLDVVWITLQIAFFGAMVLAAPFVIYFIGQFILPALRVQEKEFLKPFALWGTVLFLSGVGFCYFVILPLMLRMTVEFSQWLGFSADQWRAQEYLSMVPKFLLAMGLGFEMPVVILTIVKVGLLDSKKLTWFRSYFIVLNLFICALVSPSGDPITMIVMAAPLCVLYEACILIARFWEWRDRQREQAKKPIGDKL